MLQPKPHQTTVPPPPRHAGFATTERDAPRPFFGAIDSLIVADPAEFKFTGAIGRNEAQSVWTWLVRDVAPDLVDPAAPDRGAETIAALEAVTPALLGRAQKAIAAAASNPEAERRLRGQLGSKDVLLRCPAVFNALKCVPLLAKAEAFGRAVNSLGDDHTLVAALQAMPRQNADIASVLMMAAVARVANPARLVTAATHIAGDATETGLRRAGFAPLVEAYLAHAQNTLPPLLQVGAFADMDLICKAIDRFHRLVRAIGANIELARPGQWGPVIAGLTKRVSDRLEPRVRDVVPDLNRALRRQRDAIDRLDSDALLAGLNGIYLLVAVRDCRDSLALNEAFEETWERSGQVLEMHVTRNLDALRANPADAIATARLDTGIKMAELRFGADYAQVLRRARDGFDRR